MILHIDPNAPWWVHAAAGTALVLHIGGGGIGLASGAVTAFTRKGATAHRLAGKVFVASMLVMAGVAVAVAPMLPQRISTVAALLTLYLVLTGWITARRKSPKVGPFDIAAFLGVIGIIAYSVSLGLAARVAPNGEIDGQGGLGAWMFAGIAAIAATCDLIVMLNGGISGAPRIARHLWRMLVPLILGAGSLFQGQPQVFPEPLRGSLILAIPTFGALLLLVFWMLRVRLTRAWRRLAPA